MKNLTNPEMVGASSRRQRLLLILGMTLYVGFYQWMYINYLYPTWAYFGFDYHPPATRFLVLAWALSLLPSLWMPIELQRPSQLAYWILYIVTIIPSMFVPLFVNINPPAEISMLMVVLFMGFAAAGSSYLLPLIKLRKRTISQKTLWIVVGCLACGFAIWVIAVFGSHLKLVSFENVYDQRFGANDVTEDSLVSYAFMGLNGAIDPFLMAYGLYYRRKWMFLAGMLGQLLVYSAIGTKASLLSVVFIPGFYFLFRIGRLPFGLKMCFGAVALIGGASIAFAMSGYDPGLLLYAVLFVVLQRTLSLGGLVTAWAYNFFQQNPLTYYSNLQIVKWFVHDPYQGAVRHEVGSFYMGANVEVDGLGHMFATDGIAALGLAGILIVGIVCALVFWFLDSAAQRHDPRLPALVVTYAAYNIANNSIFTTLFSGGLALLMLLLYYLQPRAGRLPSQGARAAPLLRNVIPPVPG